MSNWDNYRAHRLTKDRPESWPQGVYGISVEGLNLLGIHEQTNRLYWDGREIEFRRIKLGLYEQVVAGVVALGTFGVFAIEAGKSLGWWH